MSRNKLLIIEGPDGAGKTTLASMLAEHTESRLIVQPSKTNCVSFIRDWTKDINMGSTPAERQFLMAISHSVDAFTEFNDDISVVMDRSWISGFVYGTVNGMSLDDVKRYETICRSIYKQIFSRYDVVIVFLYPYKSLKKTDTKDHWETAIRWGDIQASFDSLYRSWSSDTRWFFDPHELVFQLRIQEGEFETETIQKLIEIWEKT